MPVGEIAGEFLGGILKFIGRFFAEFIFEMLIKGTGYLICKRFSKRVDPEGALVVLVGLVFLGLVGVGVLFVYDFIQLQHSIDSCLDSGGEFEYQTQTCEQGSQGKIY
ncbi:MAG: hypothetical protein ABJI60_00795 [Kangiellaceae bacterium]